MTHKDPNITYNYYIDLDLWKPSTLPLCVVFLHLLQETHKANYKHS